MNLQIHNPDLAQRVSAQIRTRRLHGADELIEQALEALDQVSPAVDSPSTTPNNLLELAAPMRGLFTDDEIDTLFKREPSPDRPLDLT